MTVAELIVQLQALPQEMPVVVTVGVGEFPRWPEPERQHVLIDNGEPMWSDAPGVTGVVEVIWL